MDSNISKQSPFDQIRRIDEQDNEYWLARELMPLLGYESWRRFENPIRQAIENLELNEDKVSEHFLPAASKSQGRDGKDYKLSRYACYMVALCCDGRKIEVASAKKYFAIKTRQAETLDELFIEAQKPVDRVLPQHTAVEYADAAHKVQQLPQGILKQLLTDALVDEIELNRNLKYLPVAEKPKKYTIARVRARELGYSEKQIGDGTQLGKFVKSQIEPSFQEMVGKYPVYHYEINECLDRAIHDYFNKG